MTTNHAIAIAGALVLLFLAAISLPGHTRELDCLTCHGQDPAIREFNHGVHGRYFANQGSAGCQTCHGASVAHRQNPANNPVDRLFGEGANAPAANETCLGCHRGAERHAWEGSAHALADLECSSCHRVHTRKDPVLETITQAGVCLDCHSHMKADQRKFSRHPVAEGIVGCTSCHQPHGGKGPSMLVEATVNETCFQCHTEKRGPLLFEHEPVQDNCLNCHNPHASVNDNLLVTRQPLLCQQCHIASRHPGTNYVTEEEWQTMDNRLIGKSCTNCHSQVHGSNHPAGFTFRR